MNSENCEDNSEYGEGDKFSASNDSNCSRLISSVQTDMPSNQYSCTQEVKSDFSSVTIKCEEPDISDSDTLDFKPQILNPVNTNEQSDLAVNIKPDLFGIESHVKQEFVSNQGTGPPDTAIKYEKSDMSCSETMFFEEAKIWNNFNEQSDFSASNANSSVKCDPLATETFVKQEKEAYVDPSFSTFSDINSDTDYNSVNDQSVPVNENRSELKDKTSFQCDVCNETFTRRTNLKNHMLKHTGEKPYGCDVCSKTFSRLSYLNDHKRVHTGEKPFQCDICNKTFNRSCALSRHKNTHTGAKPYQCDICNKYFTQCSTLKIHKRVHSGEKPHQCDICNKSFSQSQQVRTHKRIHAGEKPYRYEVCLSIS